jgi:hypothetical protein
MDNGGGEREYPYRDKAPPYLILFVVWGLTLTILFWAVLDRGPFRGRDGRVTFGEASASAIRWSVFGLACVLATVASRWVWIDRVQGRRIALTRQGILVPRARWCWFSVEVLVDYKDITDCKTTALKPLFAGNAPGNRWLQFRAAARRFVIRGTLLPDGAFDEICGVLTERVAAARGSQSLS